MEKDFRELAKILPQDNKGKSFKGSMARRKSSGLEGLSRNTISKEAAPDYEAQKERRQLKLSSDRIAQINKPGNQCISCLKGYQNCMHNNLVKSSISPYESGDYLCTAPHTHNSNQILFDVSQHAAKLLHHSSDSAVPLLGNKAARAIGKY